MKSHQELNDVSLLNYELFNEFNRILPDPNELQFPVEFFPEFPEVVQEPSLTEIPSTLPITPSISFSGSDTQNNVEIASKETPQELQFISYSVVPSNFLALRNRSLEPKELQKLFEKICAVIQRKEIRSTKQAADYLGLSYEDIIYVLNHFKKKYADIKLRNVSDEEIIRVHRDYENRLSMTARHWGLRELQLKSYLNKYRSHLIKEMVTIDSSAYEKKGIKRK